MKNYNYAPTIIESQEDRKNFYLSHGIKPPNKFCAAVKGCFNGTHCSTLFAIPEGSESIHDAAIRVIQDEVDDAIIFEKNAKSKVLK